MIAGHATWGARTEAEVAGRRPKDREPLMLQHRRVRFLLVTLWTAVGVWFQVLPAAAQFCVQCHVAGSGVCPITNAAGCVQKVENLPDSMLVISLCGAIPNFDNSLCTGLVTCDPSHCGSVGGCDGL